MMTLVFRDFKVSCDSLRDGDGATPDTLEEGVDFFRDPDEFYNATVSALLETFGSGGPTPRRFCCARVRPFRHGTPKTSG